MFFNVAILKHTLNVTIAGFTVSQTLLFLFFWNYGSAREILGTLRSNDATAMKTSLKKWICVLLVFIAIIPTLELNS